MKPKLTKTEMTFGDLIANFYNAYGERNAKGVLRLTVKANLIAFRRPNRYVVSRATRNA